MLIALTAALLAATAPAPTADPVHARLEQRMREPLPAAPAAQLATIEELLQGPVTDKETTQILDLLAPMDAGHFVATLAALEAKTWKAKRQLSLFDKFLTRGVDDRTTFLAEFADQLNDKLDLGLTPLSSLYATRLARLGQKGSAASRDRKAKRRSNRDMARASKDLYKFLGLKDKLGLRRALSAMGDGAKVLGWTVLYIVTVPYWLPIVILTNINPPP